MHLSKGVYFTLPDKKVFLFDEHKELYLRSIVSFRDECEKLIGDLPMKICIENTNGYTKFQTEAIDILLRSDALPSLLIQDIISAQAEMMSR